MAYINFKFCPQCGGSDLRSTRWVNAGDITYRGCDGCQVVVGASIEDDQTNEYYEDESEAEATEE
jgi:hypothetical protein